MGALSPKKLPVNMGIWTPSNTLFLGPTRVHNPNGISIGSAILQGSRQSVLVPYDGPLLSLKIAPSHGDLHH